MFYKKSNRTIEEDLACFDRERFRNKRLDESVAWDDRDDLLIESVKLDTNYINLLDKESVDFEFFNAAAKEIRKIAGDMADRVEVKGRGGKVYLWYEGRDVKGNDLQFMIHLTLVSDVKVYVYITGKRNRKSLGHGGGEKRMAEVDPAYIVWLYQFISDYQVR